MVVAAAAHVRGTQVLGAFGRGALLAVSALPLLVPSFLWAIGWSALVPHLPHTFSEVLTGASGCIRTTMHGNSVWKCGGVYYQPHGGRYVVVRF